MANSLISLCWPTCWQTAEMDSTPFVEAFRELNDSFLNLIDSLSALRNLSSMAAHGQEDGRLLRGALDILMQYQDLERCSIYLLQGGQLVNVAGLDWMEMVCLNNNSRLLQPPLFERFAMGEGLVGLAAQSGRLQHCHDCSNDARFRYDSCCVEEGRVLTGSLISVPIRLENETLGVLNVSHPHPRFFSESQERLLIIFANFIAQLLSNNRLLRNLEEKVGERTRQLEAALSDAEALKRRYAELSIIDELTGLHNRRFFFPEAQSLLARSLRYKKDFCLLMLDIDHFKSINDTYGHAVGDEALKYCASVLKKEVREVDILARFGGEEFIIATPDTDQEGARFLAERIRSAIKNMRFELEDRSLLVTISIGISCLSGKEYGKAQGLLERLVGEADQALYFGKHNGRDRVSCYSEIACPV